MCRWIKNKNNSKSLLSFSVTCKIIEVSSLVIVVTEVCRRSLWHGNSPRVKYTRQMFRGNGKRQRVSLIAEARQRSSFPRWRLFVVQRARKALDGFRGRKRDWKRRGEEEEARRGARSSSRLDFWGVKLGLRLRTWTVIPLLLLWVSFPFSESLELPGGRKRARGSDLLREAAFLPREGMPADAWWC